MFTADRSAPVSMQDVRRAAQAGAGIVRHTPILSSYTLTERTGATVVLKAENLQRTGSFKLRGALSKIAALGEACARGVVTGSAGNHAQAVAYAARERGVRCEVFMPDTAAIAKVEAASALGAIVHLGGASVDEAVGFAHEHGEQEGLAFVHPFDDPDVIAAKPGRPRPRTARGRARHRAGDRPGRRRRVDQWDRDRAQVTAPGRRGDRRAGRDLRAVPGFA